MNKMCIRLWSHHHHHPTYVLWFVVKLYFWHTNSSPIYMDDVENVSAFEIFSPLWKYSLWLGCILNDLEEYLRSLSALRRGILLFLFKISRAKMTIQISWTEPPSYMQHFFNNIFFLLLLVVCCNSYWEAKKIVMSWDAACSLLAKIRLQRTGIVV